MMIGTMLFAIFIGNMTELVTNLDLRTKKYRKKMDGVEHFMHNENLPLNLRTRVRNFFEHAFNHSRGIPPFIDELPEHLKVAVVLHLYNDVVRSVPFFAQGSKQFITTIILKLQSKVLAPRDTLFRAGDYGNSMYFLNDGMVCVMLDQEQEIFATMSEGAFFGEDCVTGQINVREVTVYAMTWCNLLCLTSDDLEECIAEEPESRELFRNLVTSSNLKRSIERIQSELSMMKADSETPREEEKVEVKQEEERKEYPPVVLRALELHEESCEYKEQLSPTPSRWSRVSIDALKRVQEQEGLDNVLQRISTVRTSPPPPPAVAAADFSFVCPPLPPRILNSPQLPSPLPLLTISAGIRTIEEKASGIGQKHLEA
eukprot:765496-Hanusia_phi.AAC.9